MNFLQFRDKKQIFVKFRNQNNFILKIKKIIIVYQNKKMYYLYFKQNCENNSCGAEGPGNPSPSHIELKAHTEKEETSEDK